MGVFYTKVSTDRWYPFMLVDATDLVTAETGKAITDTTIQYCAEGATSWTTYTDTAAEWVEVGNGFYWLKMGASEFTTTNKRYTVRLTVAGCAEHFMQVETVSYAVSQLMSETYVKASTDKWFAVHLVDATDLITGETGKAFGDTTVQYCAGGASSWTTYTDDANTFKEAGNGYYWLQMGASEFTAADTRYLVRVSVSGCRDYSFSTQTINTVSIPATYWERLILDDLSTTLKTITTANGYQSQVSTNVETWPYMPREEELTAKVDSDFPRILIVPTADEIKHTPADRVLRNFRVRIIGMVHDRSTAVMTTLANLHGDVLVALQQDYFRSSNAIDTRFGDTTILEDYRRPHAAFSLEILVRGDRASTSQL